MSMCSDFMAVRKIPLRRRPYLIDDAAESTSADIQQASSSEGIGGSKKSLDPAVQKTLALIRKTVLSDRALHDRVRFVAHVAISYDRYGLERVADIFFHRFPFVGRGGVRFICQGIL